VRFSRVKWTSTLVLEGNKRQPQLFRKNINLNIEYEVKDGYEFTLASYHDIDGVPMASRVAGHLTHREMSNHLAWCRKNDRGKLPLLTTTVETVKKAVLRLVK
jgi:hypothetical protein